MTIIPNFRRPVVKIHKAKHQMAGKEIKNAEIIQLIKDGYNRKDIADALGISMATLATRMNRAGIRFKR